MNCNFMKIVHLSIKASSYWSLLLSHSRKGQIHAYYHVYCRIYCHIDYIAAAAAETIGVAIVD